MSLDNAVNETVATSGIAPDAADGILPVFDQFSIMSDRQLLESTARDMFAVKTAALEAFEKIGPLANSPMFSMLGKFIK